uniref:Uncharacterized protein n=1 Tax=Populus davidiana TaxID=266767 RepID=A0A6M2EFR3_9ROSI
MNILGYLCCFQHKASNFARVLTNTRAFFEQLPVHVCIPSLVNNLQAKISTKISPDHDSIPCNFFKMCNIHCTDDTLTMPSVLQRTTGIKCLKSQRRASYDGFLNTVTGRGCRSNNSVGGRCFYGKIRCLKETKIVYEPSHLSDTTGGDTHRLAPRNSACGPCQCTAH